MLADAGLREHREADSILQFAELARLSFGFLNGTKGLYGQAVQKGPACGKALQRVMAQVFSPRHGGRSNQAPRWPAMRPGS